MYPKEPISCREQPISNIINLIQYYSSNLTALHFIAFSVLPSRFQFFLTESCFEFFVTTYKKICEFDYVRHLMLGSLFSHPKMQRYFHTVFGIPLLSFIFSVDRDKDPFIKVITCKLKTVPLPFPLVELGIEGSFPHFIIDFITHDFPIKENITQRDVVENLVIFSFLPYYLKNVDFSIISSALDKISNIDIKLSKIKTETSYINSTSTFLYSLSDEKLINSVIDSKNTDANFIIKEGIELHLYEGKLFIEVDTPDMTTNHLYRVLEMCGTLPSTPNSDTRKMKPLDYLKKYVLMSIQPCERIEALQHIKKIKNIKDEMKSLELPELNLKQLIDLKDSYQKIRTNLKNMKFLERYQSELFVHYMYERHLMFSNTLNPIILPPISEIIKNPEKLAESYHNVHKILGIDLTKNGNAAVALIRIASNDLTLDKFKETETSCNFDTLLNSWFSNPNSKKGFDEMFGSIKKGQFSDESKLKMKLAFCASDPFLIVHLFFKSMNEVEEVDRNSENWMNIMARLVIEVSPERSYSVFGFVSTFLKQFQDVICHTDIEKELSDFSDFSSFFVKKVFGDFLNMYNRIIK